MGRPWFSARPGGRGLRPVSREGWAVTALFVLAVLLFAALFRPFTEDGETLLFGIFTGAAVAVYGAIASRHRDRG